MTHQQQPLPPGQAQQKTVALVYFNAGGGHRAAALALQEVLAQPGPSGQPRCAVRLVNLLEVLDAKARFRRMTGMAPEDLYNKRLARGWTLGLAQELKLLQAMIRLGHAWLLRTLHAHWAADPPELVVSLVPNFNRAIYESAQLARPGRPVVTVMTDLADHPPHFWIEPGQPLQHLVCGTPRAMAQAQAAGMAAAQVHAVSGMILRPAFHRPVAMPDRDQALRELGLQPGRPTGLVMFGGQGSMQMLRIARGLGDVQLILACGHNAALAQRLRSLPRAAPHAVLGFTPDMARVMALADFFIGKPGPGSLSEAVHMGLPVLSFENRWIMPQERYNAQWLRDEGLGEVVGAVDEMPAGAQRLLQRLPDAQAHVRQVRNRAVFEVAELLLRLLSAPADERSDFAGRRADHAL